jgi:hypothetical protein
MQALNRMPIVIKLDYVVSSICFSNDDNELLFNHSSNAVGRKFTIEAWPISLEKITSELCSSIGRNFTREEWKEFIPPDYPYEKVCNDISN